MKKLLREPLIHFFVLGALVFLVHRFTTGDTAVDPQSIVVTREQVAALAERFTGAWQRPPTREEIEGLVRDHVHEEIYYREALALGLDRDDIVVRRRLRQKLEFVLEDTAALGEPTEEELRAFLDSHGELFSTDIIYSFSQVYLDPERRRDTLATDAAQLLAGLRHGDTTVDASIAGDRILLDHSFENIASAEIGKLFGDSFEASLRELEPGLWHGPIESGYGSHLVRIRERSGGGLPELAEIRDAVRTAWLNVRRQQKNEEALQSLLKRYKVTVERSRPAATGGRDGAAAH